MKNKDKYTLTHLDFEVKKSEEFARTPVNRITLIYENKPILTFSTNKKPVRAIFEWLEEEMENY